MSEAITAMGDWTVYLSGEIHTDWRERITEGARDRDLPVAFVSPVTVLATGGFRERTPPAQVRRAGAARP